MAELANRLAFEADFAAKLSRLSSRHRRELIELMGSLPDPSNVPREFWAKVEEEHQETVTSILLLLFIAAGEQHIDLLLPSDLRAVATEGLTDQATEWAADRAATVSKQYAERSQQLASKLSTRWYGPDFAINRARGDLKPPGSDQVQSGAIEIFGPNRDATVATTETTQAATAGTNDAIGRVQELGIEVSVTWYTERDARVCPICQPLHGLSMPDWEAALSAANVPPAMFDAINAAGGPPIHPNCRCWLETKVVRQ